MPSGVIRTPCPLRLPSAYSPSNSTSGLPFSVHFRIPRPDANPSLHGPDHVTDSFGAGSGFQTLHGLFVVVIQSGGVGLSFWAIASDVTNNIVAVAMMMPGRFIGRPQSLLPSPLEGEGGPKDRKGGYAAAAFLRLASRREST